MARRAKKSTTKRTLIVLAVKTLCLALLMSSGVDYIETIAKMQSPVEFWHLLVVSLLCWL